MSYLESSKSFLERKRRKYFEVLDIDNDGLTSKKDWEEFGKRMTAESHTNKKSKEDFQKHLLSMWESIIEADGVKRDQINADEFIACLAKRDPKEIRDANRHMAGYLFRLIDSDSDGILQWSEYTAFFKAVGIVGDEMTALNCFKAVDVDEDGKIDEKDLVHAFSEFMDGKHHRSPHRNFFGPLDSGN